MKISVEWAPISAARFARVASGSFRSLDELCEAAGLSPGLLKSLVEMNEQVGVSWAGI
jgi:hypothetical protein